ncbi:MFS transporter [Amycolatopsis mongoliensis]|uniref:MFS transporter n=1 Tax=Amycolatopsis mongoliensis TaxID=715475 RepID=A0A9Y2NAE7_9PSEU|nr:MFS transporter [Amycolatopsis sp. 4-36]WIX98530.1 MFS transporter [Amycolatopsis sp. 4-36]
MTSTQFSPPVAGPARAWLGAGLALAAIGWGANQFAPLIVLYQQRFGLSPAAAGAVFGLYALGLIPALLAGGKWSDAAGRRPVVLTALAMSFAATCLLMAGGTQPIGLYAGRLLAGVASGLAFGTGAAWLKELSAGAGDAAAGPRRTTVSMTVGFAAGPFVAGLCAQWLPAPATTAYGPHLLLLLAAAIAVRRTPDPGGPAATRTRPAGNSGVAVPFMVVLLPFAPWVFGTAAIALAYLPALVADQVSEHALLFSAVATATTALTGILVQPLAKKIHRTGGSRLLPAAMLAVLTGIGCAAWAASAMSPAAVLLASAVLGAAYGLTQFAGLVKVQEIAADRALGTATAAYQVLSYLGFALPFLISFAQARTHVAPAVLLLVVLGAAVVATAWIAVTAHAPRGPASARRR